MLTASGLSLTFGARTLWRDVTLTLGPGRRVALVGGNGIGKTTLLEVVVGQRDPDGGTVTRPGDMRIGYLPQEGIDAPAGSVLDHVLSGAGEVAEAHVELETLQHRLEADTTSGAAHDELVAAYGEAQHRYETLGGYSLESDAHRVLAGLGFAPDDASRPIAEMSGGWRMRAGLARLLVADPDVLVLDEPTNHLDVDSVAWLEQHLADRTGGILFVSHDRDFIDAVATHVVEITGGRADTYTGGFAEFVAEREERLEAVRRTAMNQQKQVAATEKFIERFRYKATKARQVQSRVKALERLDRIEVPTAEQVRTRFGFPPPPRTPRTVVEVTGADVGYDDGPPVLSDVDLVVERGQRVALLGPNGAGKTTLLKLLLGELSPSRGDVTIAAGVRVARFDQHQADTMDPALSVIQQFRLGLSPQAADNTRSWLGAFGFSGDAAEARVAVLSGGERTRLALGRIMVEPANLLVLDEPTNHLDLPSCDLLADALRAYPGTVLLVTHDRYLIREVATDLVEVRGGRVRSHHGVDERLLVAGGSDSQRPSSAATSATTRSTPAPPRPPKQRAAPPGGSSGRSARERKDAKRSEADQRNARHRSTKDLRTAQKRAERAWERAEEQVAALQRELADPTTYEDAARVRELTSAHEAAKEQADKAMAAWDRATQALERGGR